MKLARNYVVLLCPACRHPHPGVTPTYTRSDIEGDTDERFQCAHGGRMVSVREEGVDAVLAPENA